MFDKIVLLNRRRILSVFLRKNARPYKSFKMLQLPTNVHSFQISGYKSQNSLYVFDWNILAFQAFVVSCFGQ